MSFQRVHDVISHSLCPPVVLMNRFQWLFLFSSRGSTWWMAKSASSCKLEESTRCALKTKVVSLLPLDFFLQNKVPHESLGDLFFMQMRTTIFHLFRCRYLCKNLNGHKAYLQGHL